MTGRRAAFRDEIAGGDGAEPARLRRERGMSQEELADHAGVYRNYIGMLERAENAATVDMLEKLAAVLQVDAAAFLVRSELPDGSATSAEQQDQ